MNKQTWNLASLWNECVYSVQRPLEERDYCYASEIGQPLVDRYLKMRAVTPTNPPNMRSLRKFEAGNLVEWVVRYVLERAGLIQETQERVMVEYPNKLRVSGRLDFLAGGKIDLERAKQDITSSHLPESIQASSLYIAEKLYERFGDMELETKVLEIKSCSSFVMDMMEKTEKPIKHHRLQLFHYMKGLNLNGELVYICKDDLRMMCFDYEPTEELEQEYLADLAAISHYYTSNTRPPLEKLIVFEDGKFKKNFGIEYSNYLKFLYDFEEPRDYSDSVKSQVARWSRVIARYAKGDKITAKNEEVRKEIENAGYDFMSLVETAKRVGVTEEETED